VIDTYWTGFVGDGSRRNLANKLNLKICLSFVYISACPARGSHFSGNSFNLQ
jgi:hypothetical protein